MKGKKWATRAIALLMVVISLFAFYTVQPSATNAEIYYSDLFYGYSSSYLRSSELSEYASKNYNVMSEVFSAYIDSDDAIWMKIKTGLSAATNLKQFIELVSDGFGNTDYNYQNALDKANEEFAKKLLSDSSFSSQISIYGTSKKIAKKAKDIISVYEKVRKEIDWKTYSDEDIFQTYIFQLSEEGIYEVVPASYAVLHDVLPELKKLGTAFDTGAKVLEGAGAFSLALMIEDIRMEIIEEIITNSIPGSYIHDGMSRLKSQLRNGWESYLFDNYAKDMVLGELSSILLKEIGNTFTTYGLVSAILKVASWVVFDVIMDVPSLEECLVQQTLTNYASGIYSAMRTKQVSFNNPFDTEDVFGYENLFCAYIAAVNAGLDASEKLTTDSNKYLVTNIKNKYKSFNYDSYIEQVKSFICSVQPEELKYRTITDWDLPASTKFLAASDEIEENTVYTFNGAIQGNVRYTSNGKKPLQTDCNPLNINGDLTVYGSLVFDRNRINVEGSTIVGYLYMQHDEDYLFTKGSFLVGHNVTTFTGSVSSDHLIAGTLEIKGNFNVDRSDLSVFLESGTHKTILSGDSLQTVRFTSNSSDYGRNYFENLVFENPNVSFETPIYKLKLTQDTFVSNESEIIIIETFDLNGYQFKTNGSLQAETLKSNGGRFEVAGDMNVTSSANISGQNNLVKGNAYFRSVAFDESQLTVEGNTNIGYLYMTHDEDYLFTKGTFLVGRNVTTFTGSVSSDHLIAGTLEIKGDFYVDRPDLSVFLESGTHKTILSGDSLQTVRFASNSSDYGRNYFKRLILLNESQEGIVFSTPIQVKTLFNHNQNAFTLYNNGSGSTFVDYDGDGLKDNVDPYPTLKPGSAEDFVIAEIEPQRFAGTPVMATLTVTCQDETLEEGKHYAVEYMNNNKPGTATAIITGIDNFTGSVSKDFTIYCDHVYTPTVTKTATCAQTGVRTFTCFCGDSYTEVIPVVAHTPGQWITVQTATTQEEGRMEQRCTVCNALLNSKKIDRLPQKAVEIAGIDGTTERTVDYKTTITFHSDLDTSVEDGEVHWYVNGKDRGQGKDFTVDEATSTYTVQSKVIKDGVVIAESSIETIKVKSNFLQRIIAFIKRIFNRKAFFIDQR